MKRPMLLCGLLAITISIVFGIAPSNIAVLVAATLITALIVFACLGGRQRVLFLVPMILVLSLLSVKAYGECKIIEKSNILIGEQTVYGTVVGAVGYEDSIAYTIDAERVGPIYDDCKVMLFYKGNTDISVGDYGYFKASFEENCQNPVGDRDEGVYFLGLLDEVLELHDGKNAVEELRSNIKSRIYRKLNSREAGLILGITLGNSGGVDEQVKENFRATGVSHVIAVSGLHLSILVGGLYTLLLRIKMNFRLRGIIGILFTLALMTVTGFTMSVVRAGLAFLIMFICVLFGRKPDSINSLFIAITLLLVLNPFAVFSVSLQLSSAATFGILVVAPLFFEGKHRRKRRFTFRFMQAVKISVIMAVSASVVTLPFSIYHFGAASAVSILSNVIVTPLATAVLALSFFAMLAVPLLPIHEMLLLASGIMSRALITVTEALSRLPVAKLEFTSPESAVAVSAAVALTVVTVLYIKYDKIAKQKKEENIEYADLK
ncbi:MAG: ComEC/Rec2 family competence protein [Clostridia bacterium]|nr:ComEC/Rec2 family competence protein [Clostridia bacterium]